MLTHRDRAIVGFGAIAAVYAGLAFVLPHPYPSYDEAKYLAIGSSALAGLGPLTAFGDRFLIHSPVWPMLFAAPQVALGLDPWAWGYLLNAIGGAAVLWLGARMTRRFGLVAAVLATAALAGWVGLFGLTRTARLDVPEAALSLAYLAVASSAVRTGSVRRGILAGVLFASAFLVKESSLVLLGVPFIAGLALRRPIGRIASAAGLTLLTTIPLVSWWFAWYGTATGRVYTLGLAGSLLAPLGAMLGIVAVAMIALGWLPGPGVTARARLDQRLANRATALAVALALLAAWIVVFLVAFSKADVQAGRTLLDGGHVLRWARTWMSDLAGIGLLGLGALGAAIAVARGDDRPIEPLVGFLASTPWLLLVAVLGEPPRNDIAALVLLAAAGAGGWLLVADALRGHERATTLAGALVAGAGALVIDGLFARAGIATRYTRTGFGIGGAAIVGAIAGAALCHPAGRARLRRVAQRPRALAAIVADGRLLAAALAVLVALATLGALSVRSIVASPNLARPDIAADVARWLEANLPAGSTVMFGSVRGNETALVLDGRYRLRRLQATIGVTSPTAPLGVMIRGRPVPDLVSIDAHPRQHGFLVFAAATIRAKLLAARPAAIVYVTGLATAAPSMIDWLASATGISLATTISGPPGGTPLIARIYRVDLATLQVPTDRTYASPAAILQLLDDLGSAPQAPAIAKAWLGRVVITGAADLASPAMARLRSVAAR